jgi:hypothetical protein
MLHNHNQNVQDFKTTMESVPNGEEFKFVIHVDRKHLTGVGIMHRQ